MTLIRNDTEFHGFSPLADDEFLAFWGVSFWDPFPSRHFFYGHCSQEAKIPTRDSYDQTGLGRNSEASFDHFSGSTNPTNNSI